MHTDGIIAQQSVTQTNRHHVAHDGATEDADESALRALYDMHAGSLLNYVLRLTRGDRWRAEDVVQETMFRAWRNRRVLHSTYGSAGGWLHTVARNLVIDQERTRSKRPAEVGEDALGFIVEPSHTPDEAFTRALLSWQLIDALATLTPKHRAVLHELYYRERSVGETAVELGIPPGTVKSRAFYAVRALRVACQERGLTR